MTSWTDTLPYMDPKKWSLIYYITPCKKVSVRHVRKEKSQMKVQCERMNNIQVESRLFGKGAPTYKGHCACFIPGPMVQPTTK